MTRVPTQSAKARARNDGLSKQMKRRIERRRCPKCLRGDAITRVEFADGMIVKHCRWCDYSRGYYLDDLGRDCPA